MKPDPLIWQFLENLPQGWIYNAPKINSEFLQRARVIAELAEKQGWWYQPFPREDGGVSLYLRLKEKSIEIIFYKSGEIDIDYLQNDKTYKEKTYESFDDLQIYSIFDE